MNDWLSASSPLTIGHRGASAYAPENTLAAFELALDQGADGIELDVHLCADGCPVIIHDSAVERTTDGQGEVSSFTVQEIQSLNAGEGQHVPTLDELFEAFGPTFLYNIELKEFGWSDNGLVAAVADRIESYSLQHRVLISSFNPRTVRRSRRQMPLQTATALLRAPGMSKYGFLVADGEADHPHYSMVDEGYLAWARRRGYRTHVWTVDDPVEAKRLVTLGVHGIITNKPDLIRRDLQA